ncbi:hypothetical protein GGX14DRAFT_396995 [Mycena pura]|uniref:Uncharacterized protein n=1 Tax=Mycena pura TaxID=153505 RepID=A0AAD6YB03_9AGAR|nr:hypothetical protein GGX14DRAFT_396995 [Mycena pura]
MQVAQSRYSGGAYSALVHLHGLFIAFLTLGGLRPTARGRVGGTLLPAARFGRGASPRTLVGTRRVQAAAACGVERGVARQSQRHGALPGACGGTVERARDAGQRHGATAPSGVETKPPHAHGSVQQGGSGGARRRQAVAAVRGVTRRRRREASPGGRGGAGRRQAVPAALARRFQRHSPGGSGGTRQAVPAARVSMRAQCGGRHGVTAPSGVETNPVWGGAGRRQRRAARPSPHTLTGTCSGTVAVARGVARRSRRHGASPGGSGRGSRMLALGGLGCGEVVRGEPPEGGQRLA